MFLLRLFLQVLTFTVACASESDRWNFTDTRSLQPRTIADGVELRILPLGDSITAGAGSGVDGNGYRYFLMNNLKGNKVTYIGSVRSGHMVNNQHEGHSGAVISEIEAFAEKSLYLQPNVILVMAGTNDIDRAIDREGAPERLGHLIDKIIAACPDATIVVAQITPIKDPAKNAAVQAFNAAISGIVAARVERNAKVLTVDMGIRVTTDLFADNLHPNDLGYIEMANTWFEGIQQAAEKGWITEPIPVAHNTCDTFVSWDGMYGTIATGVGSGDVPFVPGWQPAGRLATGIGKRIGVDGFLDMGAGVHLADIDGDGRDDYLWVHPFSGAATLFLNGGYSTDGGINWIPKGQVATGVVWENQEGRGVMFADINGDGREDYLWVASSGEVTAYLNGGEQSDGSWLWTNIGQIVQGTGATRDTTRFSDIDGDGRADYLVVGSDGSLSAWLNFGYDDKPDWRYMGTIASGIGDGAGVVLHDLNNDGRADYIWLAKEDGAAKAYMNTRGASIGLAPDWVDAGIIATGVGAPRSQVTFGDLNGDGKKDYIWVDRDTGALDVWFNTGSGGSYVVGDGTTFADLNGDGFDDYLAISPNGAIELWSNHGYDESGQKWIWESEGQIATGVADRKNIRFADLDGDGRADYLVVDEKSGAVVFWRNDGRQADGTWGWTNTGQVATGVGEGAGVQFVDIDGDGKADYLWVAKNGAVNAWLNGGSGIDGWVWKPQGVIALGVGGLRQDIKFADINGDGLADYLWVNRFDGSVSYWRNGGFDDGIWQFHEEPQLATGVGANGLAIHFADLDGSGRADYLSVAPASGAVNMWVNRCFGDSSTGTKWTTAQCGNAAIVNPFTDPKLRWNAVDTTTAWIAAIADWVESKSPEKGRFPRQISFFFNAPEDRHCGLTADHNGCDTTLDCKDVNHPAGMFILNSMTQINRMNMNFYDAIHNSVTELGLTSKFSDTFAKIEDDNAMLKVVLDFVSLGYGMVMAPVWNVALKKLPYFKDGKNGNTWATVKDETNNAVTNAISIVKDSALSGVKLQPKDSLEAAMATLLKYWAKSVKDVNENLFNGSPDSIEKLTHMINDGRMLGDLDMPDDEEIQTYVKKAVYAWLIPQAWSLGKKSGDSYHPVIIDSGKGCGDKKEKYLKDQTAESASVCHEGRLYYLVSASGDHRSCFSGPGLQPLCRLNKFGDLSGIDALEKGDFGGVTKTDLVIGALAGYAANGNKNGWPPADPSQGTTVSNLQDEDKGIRSPGVVMIPVCSAEQAYDGWSSKDFSAPGYPCLG